MTSKFTIFGVTVIITLVLITAWFYWAIEKAYGDDIKPRAITAQMHQVCADMPRGNQEMEEERHECFKKLYKTPWSRAY